MTKRNFGSHIEQSIEFNGNRLTLIWNGRDLYAQAQFGAKAIVTSLNDYEDGNGNVTIQFGSPV